MYSLPISHDEVIAIDDYDPDEWTVYLINFATRSIDGFDIEGLGAVQFAYYDHGRELVWILVDGTIFAIQRSKEAVFEVPAPETDFFIYSLVGEGSGLYVGGEYSNLWRLNLPALDWTPLLVPEPQPPRADDEERQTLQVREYSKKYPPYYHGFQVGDDYYFCGALGAFARIRDDTVELTEVDAPARLVRGVVEGQKILLSSDSSGAVVYVGSFNDGFEILFNDPLPALNLSASYSGQRYFGVAGYPPSDVHNLYVMDDGELTPVETHAAREPLALTSLGTQGNALFATDPVGVFRLSDGAWLLVDDVDMRRRSWPEDL